jgi:hypothetical protein
VSDAQHHMKQRVVHEAREYFIISLYLFVVLALFIVHKAVVLGEHHIDYTLHGFALFNALALAKVMLFAQDLHFAEWLDDAPLIYPTLLKSFLFTIVLACFEIAEEFAIGKVHGKSFQESVAEIGGGTGRGIVTVAALLFVMLIPFFGFTELRRVFGDRLFALFFRSRSMVKFPQEGDAGPIGGPRA